MTEQSHSDFVFAPGIAKYFKDSHRSITSLPNQLLCINSNKFLVFQEEHNSSIDIPEHPGVEYIPSDEEEFDGSRCKIDYRRTILFAERKNLTLRETATIINLVHTDCGNNDPTVMISPTGIRSQKLKNGMEILEEHKAKKGFECLKYDGKFS